MKRLFLLFTITLFWISGHAQVVTDILHLKNGSMIKCIVLEQVFGESIKVQTADGSVFVFKADEVSKLEKIKPAEPNNRNENISETETTVTDFDGNIYQKVRIGNQTWMSENLKTTHYNDGVEIWLVMNNEEWVRRAKSSPIYCRYGSDHLYNNAVVETGEICPKGWHVPIYEELIELIRNNKQKIVPDGLWIGPNAEKATKENPGEALFFPATGFRWTDGDFYHKETVTSIRMHDNHNNAARFDREYQDGYMRNSLAQKDWGCSIRCIKD